MEFSFMTEPQAGGTYAELLDLARWAEQAGFDTFARSDHYLNNEESVPATDSLTTLAGLARDTERIRLTCLMTPITFRHPGVLAKTAVTIDEMSGGRLELGVGTGWMRSEHEKLGIELPPLRERFSLLYETLAYLEAATATDEQGYRGRHFALQPIPVLPGPTGPLPIIIGGSGPRRTPRLAGRFGDEYNMFSVDEETMTDRIKVMREAAEDAGRDPSEVKVSFIGLPVVGDNEAEVKETLARRAAARGMDAAEYEALMRERDVPVGTKDEVGEAFATLAARGLGRYYIQVYAPLSSIDTDEIEQVLAAARGA